jgi:hypothetical protein
MLRASFLSLFSPRSQWPKVQPVASEEIFAFQGTFTFGFQDQYLVFTKEMGFHPYYIVKDTESQDFLGIICPEMTDMTELSYLSSVKEALRMFEPLCSEPFTPSKTFFSFRQPARVFSSPYYPGSFEFYDIQESQVAESPQRSLLECHSVNENSIKFAFDKKSLLIDYIAFCKGSNKTTPFYMEISTEKKDSFGSLMLADPKISCAELTRKTFELTFIHDILIRFF